MSEVISLEWELPILRLKEAKKSEKSAPNPQTDLTFDTEATPDERRRRQRRRQKELRERERERERERKRERENRDEKGRRR